MTLTARPTTYNGIKMRSRLEATVASHLDRWGYDWRYEPRAFASPDGQYLPDFELWNDLGLRTVVEVKGAMLEDPYAVLDRMEIVWATEPKALLVLIEAEAIGSEVFRRTGQSAYTVLVRFRLNNGQWCDTGGVFALCRCGVVGLRLINAGEQFIPCRGCGSNDPVVAYLNPTEYPA